jgi:hypothetical protein
MKIPVFIVFLLSIYFNYAQSDSCVVDLFSQEAKKELAKCDPKNDSLRVIITSFSLKRKHYNLIVKYNKPVYLHFGFVDQGLSALLYYYHGVNYFSPLYNNKKVFKRMSNLQSKGLVVGVDFEMNVMEPHRIHKILSDLYEKQLITNSEMRIAFKKHYNNTTRVYNYDALIVELSKFEYEVRNEFTEIEKVILKVVKSNDEWDNWKE